MSSFSLHSFFKLFSQLGLLLIFWWIGSLIQSVLNLPISAGVLGLLCMLLALLSGKFQLEWIKSGSDFILSELVLMFVPCVVGLIKYHDLFIRQGWQLITAVLIGTLCVMIVTAYSVYMGFKLESWYKRKISKETLASTGEVQ